MFYHIPAEQGLDILQGGIIQAIKIHRIPIDIHCPRRVGLRYIALIRLQCHLAAGNACFAADVDAAIRIANDYITAGTICHGSNDINIRYQRQRLCIILAILIGNRCFRCGILDCDAVRRSRIGHRIAPGKGRRLGRLEVVSVVINSSARIRDCRILDLQGKRSVIMHRNLRIAIRRQCRRSGQGCRVDIDIPARYIHIRHNDNRHLTAVNKHKVPITILHPQPLCYQQGFQIGEIRLIHVVFR